MNTCHQRGARPCTRALLYAVIATLIATPSANALAALADLADVPLASDLSNAVKPNLLFTLDDSGSMLWGHMPDDRSAWRGAVGYKNHLCNFIYYNPGINYLPPVKGDGSSFSDANFTAASSDGYAGGANINLSASFQAFDPITGASSTASDSKQPAYYYRFRRAGTPSNDQCAQDSSAQFPHSSNDFIKVQVSSTSGPGGSDERKNFANWFSYYRTRMMMMKGATGRAFANLSSNIRVGFITINPGRPVTETKYLPIADFDATQKTAWYAKLYGQSTSGATPLRQALSRAGRHFAGKQDGINAGMSGDPVLYSCQKNYSLLTTDGYWNGSIGVNLDGTEAVGNTDGTLSAAPRPMFDGSSTTTTTTSTTTTEAYSTNNCNRNQRKIIAYVTTTVSTVSGDGSSTSPPDSSQSTVESCSRNQRTLAAPITTTRSESAPSGGSSNSLADVAQYYYVTDLRPAGSKGANGTDVGTENNVPTADSGVEADTATHQHMTTFTMGLGLSGQLQYNSEYLTATSGDFANIRQGKLNWPTPVQDDPTALDDLWHTAVNGRGQFFNASDPDSVIAGLSAALSHVTARIGAASAAATSNLEPVAGDNFAYTASYTTSKWTGDLQAKELDLVTGAVGATTIWSAQTKLDQKTNNACDNRVIKLFRSGATDNLVNFSWNTSACNGAGNASGTAQTELNPTEQAWFDTAKLAQLSHYTSMTDGSNGTANQRSLAAGAALVNYLRGQRGNENFVRNQAGALYRGRDHVLGDIVSAQPVYVKAPFATYNDSGYREFKEANKNRTPMVYAAANDGMLHAFYAGASASDTLGGEERWAFIPSIVAPELYRLADNAYASKHQFYVDGTPTVGDVYDSTASVWKTILVGGLNKGGKGFYALDVTDPANPKGLWEFKNSASCYPTTLTSDCHLGYSYGNPVISKRADGTWVVFVTSGYNNVNAPALAGDGLGYLYVLDAITGKILDRISTGAGDASTPSGLGKINNYVLNTFTNNQTERVYGVDLQGNIWRFQVNGTSSATLIATTTDASGTRQPITVKPQLADVGSPPSTFIYVGTGRYLGVSDPQNVQQQTIYAIKDTLGATAIADLRSSLKQQSLATSNGQSTLSCSIGCDRTAGWMVDLPLSGQRVNIDLRLELGTLAVASNVPDISSCTIGGSSWLNFFDAASGNRVPGALLDGTKLADALTVGMTMVRLPDGRTVVISTTSDAKSATSEAAIAVPAPQGRRISWREIID